MPPALLADQKHAVATAALALIEREAALAPALLYFELRNVLLVSERRSCLSAAQTARLLNYVRELPIEVDHDPDEGLLLILVRKHGLSVYDAAYLELAQRRGVPLATLDKALVRAARAEGVPLIA